MNYNKQPWFCLFNNISCHLDKYLQDPPVAAYILSVADTDSTMQGATAYNIYIYIVYTDTVYLVQKTQHIKCSGHRLYRVADKAYLVQKTQHIKCSRHRLFSVADAAYSVADTAYSVADTAY